MVVYDPDIKNQGRFANALINTVDIYAMILKWAGCPSPNRFDGKRFEIVPLASNNIVSVRNFIYEDQDNPGAFPFDGETIRNDRYKLIIYNDVHEFYDLLEDLFEEDNLLLGELGNKESANYDWLLNKLDNLLSTK